MEFLIIFLVWLAYFVFEMRLPKGLDNGFLLWRQRIKGLLGDSAWAPWITIFIPLLAVWLILYFTESWLLGAVELLSGLLIFYYSIGRTDVKCAVTEHQKRLDSDDLQGAYRAALINFRIDHMDDSEDRQELHQSVRQAIALDAFDLWFAPIFWILVAGPIGALLYRLCWLEYEQEKAGRLRLLLHFMNFIPCRLLVLTFALMGNFADTFKRFLESLVEYLLPTVSLLDETVCLATGRAPRGLEADPDVSDETFVLEASKEIGRAYALMERSVFAWLGVIAIAAVFGSPW